MFHWWKCSKKFILKPIFLDDWISGTRCGTYSGTRSPPLSPTIPIDEHFHQWNINCVLAWKRRFRVITWVMADGKYVPSIHLLKKKTKKIWTYDLRVNTLKNFLKKVILCFRRKLRIDIFAKCKFDFFSSVSLC